MSKIGVIGSGVVGKALAAAFARRGDDVVIGTRSPDGFDGPDGVRAATFEETAEHGEIVVLALNGEVVEEVTRSLAASLAGKVTIDTTNPLRSGEGGPGLFVGTDDSLGERVQRAAPQAHVVKCFNIVNNAAMAEPARAGNPTMLIAGDDAAAKETVLSILADFGWDSTADIGGIEGSRELESLCILWVRVGVGRGAFDHGFRLVTQ